MQQPRISPWRRAFQAAALFTFLLLPFLRVGGESALRFDVSSRTLLFFGAAVRIDELFLLLLALLLLLLGGLFVTFAFGRVWCGWACPQTSLCDFADFIRRSVSRLPPPLAAGAFLLASLSASLLTAAATVWYFISPYDFFRRAADGTLGAGVLITLAGIAGILLADLLAVRRRLCTTVCPYGRIQHMMTDSNTLTLAFDQEEAGQCVLCRRCEAACPMGIDIKHGLQIECINCGRCVDACRNEMNDRMEPGLIRYRFGAGGKGKPLNPRSLGLAAAALLLALFLGWKGAHRQEAAISVVRGAGGRTVQSSGGTANFFTIYVENRSKSEGTFTLSVAGAKGLRLLGPVKGIRLAPNENRRIDFTALASPPPASELSLVFHLKNGEKVVASSPATFSPH